MTSHQPIQSEAAHAVLRLLTHFTSVGTTEPEATPGTESIKTNAINLATEAVRSSSLDPGEIAHQVLPQLSPIQREILSTGLSDVISDIDLGSPLRTVLSELQVKLTPLESVSGGAPGAVPAD